MTTANEIRSLLPPGSKEKPGADVTGRDRMTRNVLAGWGGHLVFLAAGFVLPRMIDRSISQEALGIWDFSWSIVNYSWLVLGGIFSSVNRCVAKHRAVGDADAVNRAVSSVFVLLVIMAAIIIALTVVASAAVGTLLEEHLAGQADCARTIILVLGTSLAISVVFASFGGVITGYHRWDLYNSIQAGSHAVSVVGMVVALLLGGDLIAVAWIYLGGQALEAALRCIVAYRVCPTLTVRPRLAEWAVARSMLGFGGKSFLSVLATTLMMQTTNVLVVVYAGPAALAMFARPWALIRHAMKLVRKFAHVMTPIASSLDVLAEREELRKLLTSATRCAAHISLPIVLTLTIVGGSVLRLWMGARYDQPLVLAILAVGYLPNLVQLPALSILAGLNAHGRPGLANLIAALVSIFLVVMTLTVLHWGMVGVALSVALPLALTNGIYLPLYACKQLGLSPGKFFLATLARPVLCVVPYALGLVVVRVCLPDRPGVALAWAAALGAVLLGPVYWRYAIPHRVRCTLIDMAHRVGTRLMSGPRLRTALSTDGPARPAQEEPVT